MMQRNAARFKGSHWMGIALLLVSSAYAAKQLARVNGKPITDADLELAASGLNPSLKASLMRDPVAHKQFLDSVIDQEVLYQAAVKEKLDQTPQFKQSMEQLRRQALLNAYIDKRLSSKLSDKEARAYYAHNKTLFNSDKVHAMHILLSTEEEARRVLDQAKKPNVDFQDLAEKFSKDPSAKNNRGDLGYISRLQMAKEFSDPVFAAPENAVIGPIRTNFGYHVVKIKDKLPGKSMGYDEVEPQVRENLRQQLVKGLLDKERKSAKIQYN